MADAARADEQLARGDPLGPLHGLPVAHKDLVDTAGIRTTRGSLFYRDYVPTRDALIVTRIRAAGAITVGKTNTPEFGAGSQTFNAVFGATRNPYDLDEDRAAEAAAARPWRSPAAWCRSPTAATRAARCATRRPSATSSASAPRRAACRASRILVAAVGVGSDGALGRRRGALPQRDRRPRSAQPACDRRRTVPGSVRRSGASFKGVRVAWWQRARRHPVRAGDPPRRRRQPARLRGSRLRRSRRPSPTSPASTRRFPTLRYAANHPQLRAAGAAAARVGQGHDQVRGGPGGAADRRATSAARWRARRGCTSRAGSSSSSTTTSCCPSRRSRRST